MVRGVQVDTLGDRTEWDADFSGGGMLYVGSWDNKLHLYGEMLFRRLDRQRNGEREKQAALRHAYFTRDFETMCQLMSEE